MGDARERVEASKAARERGHPATCECKGTGLIPASGFTSGYAPCTRITIALPPSPEIAYLREEVERLTASYNAACAGWRGTVQERDEARASLARVTQERDEALERERESSAALAECVSDEVARLRSQLEGERERGRNEGIEESAQCLTSCWDDGPQGPPASQYAEIAMIRALKRSPSPATAAPVTQNRPLMPLRDLMHTPMDASLRAQENRQREASAEIAKMLERSTAAPIPKEDAPRTFSAYEPDHLTPRPPASDAAPRCSGDPSVLCVPSACETGPEDCPTHPLGAPAPAATACEACAARILRYACGCCGMPAGEPCFDLCRGTGRSPSTTNGGDK